MNPEHHWKPVGLLRRRGCIDVQVKTILTRTGIEKKIVVPDVPLLAAGAEVRRVAHSLPRGRRPRAFQRNSPTGGAACGRPRKAFSAPLSIHLPTASPWAVFTLGCGTAASTLQECANTQPARTPRTQTLRFIRNCPRNDEFFTHTIALGGDQAG